MTFKREERYIVLKVKDLEHIPNYLQEQLELLLTRINNHTRSRKYVVIESDWPEYETVWKMLEDRCKND